MIMNMIRSVSLYHVKCLYVRCAWRSGTCVTRTHRVPVRPESEPYQRFNCFLEQ